MRNIGGSVAKGSYGRITINHSREDVLDGRDLTPIPIFALITPKDYGEVKNESLSWAFSENPPTIPIARGQSEMLMVVSLEKNRIGIPRKDLFNIPSEQGFSIAENEMARIQAGEEVEGMPSGQNIRGDADHRSRRRIAHQ